MFEPSIFIKLSILIKCMMFIDKPFDDVINHIFLYEILFLIVHLCVYN